MYYSKTEHEPVSERTPVFRNIHFSGITGNAKQAGFLLGLDEMPISNISFTDIRINGEIGFTVKDAEDISFHNVQMNASQGSALAIEKGKYIEINSLSSNSPLANTPVIKLNDVEQVSIMNCFQPRETDIFIQQSQSCKDIVIQNNVLSGVKREVELLK
jgi:hypothetical protein